MKSMEPSQIFIQKLRRRIASLVVVVILSVLVVVVGAVTLQKEAEKITELRRDTASVNKGLDTLSLLSLREQRARNIYEELQLAVPDEFEAVVGIPPALRTMADEHGVRAQIEIGTKREREGGSPASIELEIRADGRLGALIDFMEGIESRPEYYSIDRFTIKPFGGSEYQLDSTVRLFVAE